MEHKTKILIGVVIAVILVVGGSLGYYEATHKAPVNNAHTLILATSAPPTSIDPAVAYDSNSVIITDQIYQTLITYGNTTYNGEHVGSLTPAPGLATSWEQFSNGSVLFNLTHNAKFSNGDPVNASDVQFSLNRVITMDQGPAFHVAAFLNSSGIHVLNTYQVLLVPSHKYAFFLNLFQLWVTSVVDPNYVNAHGGVQKDTVNTYMADHAMGSGPYNLTSYTSTELVLTANQNYWGPQPNITKFIYEIVPDPSTQQLLLQKHSINMALNIPFDEMSTVKNYSGVKIETVGTSSEYYIGFDENVSPMNNLDVRQAIEYAVNRPNIVQYSTFGYGIPLQSVIAPSVESYIPAFQNYTQNLTKAKQLLADAGYSHGLTIYYNYTSGDPVGSAIATILQSELANISITLKLDSITANTFNTEVATGHYEMFYDAWVNLLATPDDGMRALFLNTSMGLGGNYNFFNNSTVSSDILNAATIINQTQRDALYHNAQDILAQQAVEIPLFNEKNVVPVTSNVHGVIAYPTFDVFVANMQIS